MKNVAIALALGLSVSLFSLACDESEETAAETTEFDTPPMEQVAEPEPAALPEPEPEAVEAAPEAEEAAELE